MADLRVYEEIQNADQSGNELLAHIGLVKRVALHLKGRLPNFMELDELIQVGMIGLIEAKSSFDATKGVDSGTHHIFNLIGLGNVDGHTGAVIRT